MSADGKPKPHIAGASLAWTEPAQVEMKSTKDLQPWTTVGSCACGKVQVKQRRPGGISTLRCHCSHCRKAAAHDTVTKGVYESASLDWCCNVSVSGPIQYTWTCAFPMPTCLCLRRGVCRDCKTPIVNWAHGSLEGLAFVNFEIINKGTPED
eukprot:TRINITY_DN79976_c0_g1_i1.p1 TRINITY_DN79976_c0_g1~~TRINITY_DN79976_c0_g1_i1.p1  ORF type:complete len:152 (+),score=0.99 TRINITY_DN79976_c0_g1_i1:151-606(+)